MALIQDSRPNTSVSATVDPTFDALRVTMFPPESMGAFRVSARSGTIAAATAAGIMVSFRYVGTGSCIVTSVRIGLNGLSAYTQGDITFSLFPVRGYAVNATGGTLLTLGNTQKVRTQMTQPQVEIRVPTTGVLTAGTGIEDAAAMGTIQHDMAAAVINQPMKELLPMSWYSKALTLTNGEGFVVRNTAFAATGTSQLVVSIEWQEYAAISTLWY